MATEVKKMISTGLWQHSRRKLGCSGPVFLLYSFNGCRRQRHFTEMRCSKRTRGWQEGLWRTSGGYKETETLCVAWKGYVVILMMQLAYVFTALCSHDQRNVAFIVRREQRIADSPNFTRVRTLLRIYSVIRPGRVGGFQRLLQFV